MAEKKASEQTASEEHEAQPRRYALPFSGVLYLAAQSCGVIYGGAKNSWAPRSPWPR